MEPTGLLVSLACVPVVLGVYLLLVWFQRKALRRAVRRKVLSLSETEIPVGERREGTGRVPQIEEVIEGLTRLEQKISALEGISGRHPDNGTANDMKEIHEKLKELSSKIEDSTSVSMQTIGRIEYLAMTIESLVVRLNEALASLEKPTPIDRRRKEELPERFNVGRVMIGHGDITWNIQRGLSHGKTIRPSRRKQTLEEETE